MKVPYLAVIGKREAESDMVAIPDPRTFQLMPWREADENLNYRRFFSVNTLAGIRVEDRHKIRHSTARSAKQRPARRKKRPQRSAPSSTRPTPRSSVTIRQPR